MSAPVEAVLFDLGNVLLTLDWERSARRMSAATGRSVADLVAYAKDAQLIRQFGAGRVSRVDFFETLAAELGFHGPATEFEDIWSDMFHPNQPMLDLARSLKGRCPRVLLSNTNAIHMPVIFARFPEIADLDGHVLSHEVGFEKPAPEIYRYALRRHGLEAARTVFIDDLAHNVDGARAVGIRAIHYRDPATTCATLAELGLPVADDRLRR